MGSVTYGSGVSVEMHAREMAGETPDWRAYRFESIGNPGEPPAAYRVRGARVPLAKDGKPNWRKKERATDREIVIAHDAHEAWLDAWEEREGRCKRCLGAGRVWRGWSRDAGHRYATCPRCSGVGRVSKPDAVATWATGPEAA